MFTVKLVALIVTLGIAWSILPSMKGLFGEESAAAVLLSKAQEAEIFEQLRAAGEEARTLSALAEEGRYLTVDITSMRVALYNGTDIVETFAIEYAPGADSPDAVAQGAYTIDALSESEVSTVTMVQFPYFIEFGDRFALHGEPRSAQGGELTDAYAGSLIQLSTEDAATLFGIVEEGMPLYVRTKAVLGASEVTEQVPLDYDELPATSAHAFAIADVAAGQTYLVKGGSDRYPIASITKLITAAVASDAIGHGTEVMAPNAQYYTLSELFYPLLLRSDNAVANRLAIHAGSDYFVSNMNAYAHAIGMGQSTFVDASGLSPRNVSSATDLIMLAEHLYNEKAYLLDISAEETMTITSSAGSEWHMENQNRLASDPHFRGGKLGYTDEAGQTSLAIFNVPINGNVRPIAVVVLNSKDWKQDTRTLLRWLVDTVDS
jgi:D-alanyl-D-alanine endopeptidase (penicillin-binding protein 7)